MSKSLHCLGRTLSETEDPAEAGSVSLRHLLTLLFLAFSTGCWTCRLRRKKCDEKRESCSTCRSLRLTCAGYGAKPVWMDGGALEKQKAQEIKAEVHQQRKRGRHRRRGLQQRDQQHPNLQHSCQSWSSQPHSNAEVCSSTVPEIEPTSHRRPILSIDTRTQIETGLPLGPPTPVDSVRLLSGDPTPQPESRSGVLESPCMAPVTNAGVLIDSVVVTSPSKSAHNTPLAMEVSSGSADGLVVVDLDWDIFMDADVPCPETAAGAEDCDFPLPSLDTSWTSLPAFDATPVVDLEAGAPKDLDVATDYMIEHYMNDVIPGLFPFLDEQLHTTLRRRLSAFEMPGNAPARSSTLAHSATLQESGLERLGLCMDIAEKEAASRWKLEAIDQIRHAVQHVGGEGLGQSPPAHSADIALSLLQLNLLQVSIVFDVSAQSILTATRSAKDCPITTIWQGLWRLSSVDVDCRCPEMMQSRRSRATLSWSLTFCGPLRSVGGPC